MTLHRHRIVAVRIPLALLIGNVWLIRRQRESRRQPGAHGNPPATASRSDRVKL